MAIGCHKNSDRVVVRAQEARKRLVSRERLREREENMGLFSRDKQPPASATSARDFPSEPSAADHLDVKYGVRHARLDGGGFAAPGIIGRRWWQRPELVAAVAAYPR